jgi:hypothetical protein
MYNEEQKKEIMTLLEEIMPIYKENSWLKVKKYIVRYSKPTTRKLFSTRHVKSKKHSLNDFEKNLIDLINSVYKKELILKEEDTHVEVQDEATN